MFQPFGFWVGLLKGILGYTFCHNKVHDCVLHVKCLFTFVTSYAGILWLQLGISITCSEWFLVDDILLLKVKPEMLCTGTN